VSYLRGGEGFVRAIQTREDQLTKFFRRLLKAGTDLKPASAPLADSSGA
jgi:hypothetical protein